VGCRYYRRSLCRVQNAVAAGEIPKELVLDHTAPSLFNAGKVVDVYTCRRFESPLPPAPKPTTTPPPLEGQLEMFV
jgi:hypothetical protein